MKLKAEESERQGRPTGALWVVLWDQCQGRLEPSSEGSQQSLIQGTMDLGKGKEDMGLIGS